MYLPFPTHAEAVEFIEAYGNNINEYLKDEVEYIYSMPCRKATEIEFCVIVHKEDGTEYYLQCEDLASVLGRNLH